MLPADAQVITIKPPIVVRELADQLKQKPFKIIADLMESGVFANVNQAIDEKVAQRDLRQVRLPVRGGKARARQRAVHRPEQGGRLDVEDKLEDLVPAAAGGHDHGPR